MQSQIFSNTTEIKDFLETQKAQKNTKGFSQKFIIISRLSRKLL